MEIAIWVHGNIHIEVERQELKLRGCDWKEIYHILDEKYRKHQRKGGIRCVCCGERMEMVLNENAACHFRHEKDSECVGKENYRVYKASRENEFEYKFLIGKQIIRTYLESTLIQHGFRIMDGYTFNRGMKQIPDLVLQRQDGASWAIDYVTGLKDSDFYVSEIQKRMDEYKKLGFYPLFLYDSEWNSLRGDRWMSITRAELMCAQRSVQDKIWSEYLQKLSELPEGKYLTRMMRYMGDHFDVQSLVYVNPAERMSNVVRLLPGHISNWCYSPSGSVEIPFAHLFKMNENMSEFSFIGQDENDNKDQFHVELIHFVAAEEIKQKKEEERLELEKIEKENLDQERRKRAEEAYKREEEDFLRWRDHQSAGFTKTVAFNGVEGMRKTEQIKRDHEQRMKMLSNELNPDRWRKCRELNERSAKIDEKIEITDRKTMKLRAFLEAKRFQGEAYIMGTATVWKNQLVHMYVHDQNLTPEVALDKLLISGFSITQAPNIVLFTIKEVLEVIAKKLKS